MSKLRIFAESVSLFVISLCVVITGILAFFGLYSLIADKDMLSIVPAILFLALFAATIIFWIKGVKILRRDILAENSPKVLKILLPIISVILAIVFIYFPLSYFGYGENWRTMPNTCLATTGFMCTGRPFITSESISFRVVNGLGYNVNLTNVNIQKISYKGCTSINLCTVNDTTQCNISLVLPDGAATTVRISGCNFTVGTAIKGQISLDYINTPSNLPETMMVEFAGRVN
jgi:hypothetical protein